MESNIFAIQQGEYRTKISGPYYKYDLYNDDGVVVLSQWLEQPPHLDNSIELGCMPLQQGVEEMAKINRTIVIKGTKRWIRANTEQEYADKLARLLTIESLGDEKHLFSDYAWNWFETYSKPNIATATVRLYNQLLRCHILPVLGDIAAEDITSDDVQRMFNNMSTSKETKNKARRLLNQILDAAVEDSIIMRNPAKSKRIRVSGAESKTTAVYSVEQMQYLARHINDIKLEQDRTYMVLQMFHPLRLEEVLGLKWSDIDVDNMALHINRAVTHPSRNQPELKETKTKSGVRTVGLSSLALPYLTRGKGDDFVLGGDKPLSYSNVRRMRERIKRETGFSEAITPMRFRTTTLSDLYAATKDIKLTQAAAGHTTADMSRAGKTLFTRQQQLIAFTLRQAENCKKIASPKSGKALGQAGFSGVEQPKNCRTFCRLPRI